MFFRLADGDKHISKVQAGFGARVKGGGAVAVLDGDHHGTERLPYARLGKRFSKHIVLFVNGIFKHLEGDALIPGDQLNQINHGRPGKQLGDLIGPGGDR